MFKHRLALALGMTLRDIGRMDLREFNQWAAYYSLEPFGMERHDLNAGVVASTIANVMSSKGRRFQPADFMPRFGNRPRSQMSEQDMRTNFAAFKRACAKRKPSKSPKTCQASGKQAGS